MQVVSAFTGADVYVAMATVQRNMAFSRNVARRGIVRNQVAAKDIVRELNLHVAAQGVNLGRLLAFARVDNDWLLFADGYTHFLVAWSRGRSGSRRLGWGS